MLVHAAHRVAEFHPHHRFFAGEKAEIERGEPPLPDFVAAGGMVGTSRLQAISLRAEEIDVLRYARRMGMGELRSLGQPATSEAETYQVLRIVVPQRPNDVAILLTDVIAEETAKGRCRPIPRSAPALHGIGSSAAAWDEAMRGRR